MVRDGLHENRTTLKAVRQEPTPEVATLARSTDCSPSTADEREVQENDCVRRSKPNLNSVVRTQVAIHDPSFFRDEFLLQDNPLIARCCDKTCPPEDLVNSITGRPVICLARVDLPDAPRPRMTARFIFPSVLAAAQITCMKSGLSLRVVRWTAQA
jgi:hypothetical protein